MDISFPRFLFIIFVHCICISHCITTHLHLACSFVLNTAYILFSSFACHVHSCMTLAFSFAKKKIKREQKNVGMICPLQCHEEMLMWCMIQMSFTDTRTWKIISSYLQHLAVQYPMYALKKAIWTFRLPVTK